MLTDNGTLILKFMLHISKEEQAAAAAGAHRQSRQALEVQSRTTSRTATCGTTTWRPTRPPSTRCSTPHAPWHVIPADRNWVRNAAVARIVRETLEKMDPQYPAPKGWDPKTVKVV